MKPSPLQLEPPIYPTLSVRSVPPNDKELSNGPLPIDVRATVLYDGDGTHLAHLSIEQNDDTFPYLVEIDVLTSFSIDVEGCQQAYKTAFNPQVVAVNMARILYSGAREMLGLLTSRGPHGSANLPAVMIEPSDVIVRFERDKLDVILAESFGFTAEAIEATLAKLEEARVAQEEYAKAISPREDASASAKGKTAVPKRVAVKKPGVEKLAPRKAPRAHQ